MASLGHNELKHNPPPHPPPNKSETTRPSAHSGEFIACCEWTYPSANSRELIGSSTIPLLNDSPDGGWQPLHVGGPQYREFGGAAGPDAHDSAICLEGCEAQWTGHIGLGGHLA